MKHWFVCGLLIAVAFAGMRLLAAADPAPAPDAKAFPAWNGDKAIPSKFCAICHAKPNIGDQFGAWSEGPHRKAFESLKSDKAKEIAGKLGIADPSTSGECLQCHASAYGFTKEKVAPKLEVEHGVTCQGCHGPGDDYKSKSKHAENPEEAAAKYGLILPTAENTCLRCHNRNNPTFNPERYKLADGTTTDFDYAQAFEKIKHPKK